MGTNQKPIRVEDCYGPRADYFISEFEGKGNVVTESGYRPGPLAAPVLQVYFCKWAPGSNKTRSEFLEAATFLNQ
jgi:hypothetical protein